MFSMLSFAVIGVLQCAHSVDVAPDAPGLYYSSDDGDGYYPGDGYPGDGYPGDDYPGAGGGAGGYPGFGGFPGAGAFPGAGGSPGGARRSPGRSGRVPKTPKEQREEDHNDYRRNAWAGFIVGCVLAVLLVGALAIVLLQNNHVNLPKNVSSIALLFTAVRACWAVVMVIVIDLLIVSTAVLRIPMEECLKKGYQPITMEEGLFAARTFLKIFVGPQLKSFAGEMANEEFVKALGDYEDGPDVFDDPIKEVLYLGRVLAYFVMCLAWLQVFAFMLVPQVQNINIVNKVLFFAHVFCGTVFMGFLYGIGAFGFAAVDTVLLVMWVPVCASYLVVLSNRAGGEKNKEASGNRAGMPMVVELTENDTV